MDSPKLFVEKIFKTIYLPSLLICLAIALIQKHLNLEFKILKVIAYISTSLFLLIFVLAGVFNWKWAYKHPAKSKVGQNINRILSLFVAALIAVMIYEFI